MEDIERSYQPLVEQFLPNRLSDAGDIGFQIEKLKLEGEENGFLYFNFRLKEEFNEESELKYVEHRTKKGSKSDVDDVYLPVIGRAIFCGFSVKKI
jgi:hypothetical protein